VASSSNTDFRISTGLFRHPKWLKLSRRLGAEGQVALIALWAFAATDRPDGILSGMDADDIAITAGWSGPSDVFVDGLVELRWLDRSGDGTLTVHDWEENNPWAASAEVRSDQATYNAFVKHYGKEAADHWRETGERPTRPIRTRRPRGGGGGQNGAKPPISEPKTDRVPVPTACGSHARSMPDACVRHCDQYDTACSTHAERSAKSCCAQCSDSVSDSVSESISESVSEDSLSEDVHSERRARSASPDRDQDPPEGDPPAQAAPIGTDPPQPTTNRPANSGARRIPAPTRQQCHDHFRGLGREDQADLFFAYYEANGWDNRAMPMLAELWLHREPQFQRRNSGSSGAGRGAKPTNAPITDRGGVDPYAFAKKKRREWEEAQSVKLAAQRQQPPHGGN
jgi:hypothetical protein